MLRAGVVGSNPFLEPRWPWRHSVCETLMICTLITSYSFDTWLGEIFEHVNSFWIVSSRALHLNLIELVRKLHWSWLFTRSIIQIKSVDWIKVCDCDSYVLPHTCLSRKKEAQKQIYRVHSGECTSDIRLWKEWVSCQLKWRRKSLATTSQVTQIPRWNYFFFLGKCQ